MMLKVKIIGFILFLSVVLIYCVLLLDTDWYFNLIRSPLPESNDAFLIDTVGCRIPYIHHFHRSIKVFYKATDTKLIDCKGLNLLTVEDNKILLNKYKLRKTFGSGSLKSLKCIYKSIIRNPDNSTKRADLSFGYTKNKTLVFGETIKDEYIKVECYTGSEILFEDFVALLHLKPDVEKRCSKNSQLLLQQRLNIIMISIDSVSKLNFLRHFNRTYKYLHDTLHVFELHGYTKVADNTFVNMMPLLTGHFYSFYRTDKELKKKQFDDVDLIWKEYASVGYRTFYAEDSPNIGTFTYLKKGFRHPPTDYYLRPFTMAVHKGTSKPRYGCFNSRPEAAFFNDYLLRFAQMMDQRPFFAWLFHSSFTHDKLNHAGYMDRPSSSVLQDLHDSGILNKSLLLFFSDHGIRFGKIRQTYVGKIEERMPFMFLYLPRWFLNSHPDISRNLKINQRRLTSPFDIYQTLAQMVSIVSSKTVQQNETQGISLFAEIPPTRTCHDAGISPHWCTCNEHIKVSTSNSNVKKAAEVMMNTINGWIEGTNKLSPCVKLHADKITDARISSPYKFLTELEDNPNATDERSEKVRRKFGVYLDYLLTVIASPSNAVLEGTLRYDKGNFILLGASRINMYGNQSDCVQDYILRKFCFCKKYLKS